MLRDPQDFSARGFARQDPSDDALFYSVARKVEHIDEGAIAAKTGIKSAHMSQAGK